MARPDAGEYADAPIRSKQHRGFVSDLRGVVESQVCIDVIGAEASRTGNLDGLEEGWCCCGSTRSFPYLAVWTLVRKSLIYVETLRRTQVDSGHGAHEAVKANEGDILREEMEHTRFLLSLVWRQDPIASDRCCAQPGVCSVQSSFRKTRSRQLQTRIQAADAMMILV